MLVGKYIASMFSMEVKYLTPSFLFYTYRYIATSVFEAVRKIMFAEQHSTLELQGCVFRLSGYLQ